jgi:predicted nucleic acid-binding protein
MRCTIDASVFVASARSDESNYPQSRKFLKVAQSLEIYCPSMALAECAAAIARQTGDPALAEELISIIVDFPGINLISLDLSLARKAAQAAIKYKLRGADSVYVAVAEVYGSTLITWDQEMLRRCPAAVVTMTPEEGLPHD